MRKLLFFIVVVALTSGCGNKTAKAVGNSDSLAADSIDSIETFRHSEEYIRQRIDTIYKYVGKLGLDEEGNTDYNPSGINFDSVYCSQRYFALMSAKSFSTLSLYLSSSSR